MPNLSNINAPITLIGNGRSGTSLVSNIIKNHPDCTYVGETSNLIHSVFKAMISSLPKERYKDVPEVIRKQFLNLFPTDQSEWFHKPIGIPTAKRFFQDEDKFLEWYWSVMNKVFPKARYFSVFRNPVDSIYSSFMWWGRPYKAVVSSQLLMAKIIMHERSQINFVISYENLLKSPQEETKRLLDYLELSPDDNCYSAFDKKWVANKTSKSVEDAKKSKDEIREILSDEFKLLISSMYKKYSLELPQM